MFRTWFNEEYEKWNNGDKDEWEFLEEINKALSKI